MQRVMQRVVYAVLMMAMITACGGGGRRDSPYATARECCCGTGSGWWSGRYWRPLMMRHGSAQRSEWRRHHRGWRSLNLQDADVEVMQSEADCVGESHQQQRFRGAVIVEQQQRISPTSALANLHSVKVEWSVGNTRPPNHESVCLGVVVSEGEVEVSSRSV